MRKRDSPKRMRTRPKLLLSFLVLTIIVGVLFVYILPKAFSNQKYQQQLSMALEELQKTYELALNKVEVLAKDFQINTPEDVSEGLDPISDFCGIADAMIKVGELEKAKYALNKALPLTQRIKPPYYLALSLSDIASTMSKLDSEEAKNLFGEAIQAALRDTYSPTFAFRYIAGKMASAGLYDEALKVIENIKDISVRIEALSEIAMKMAKDGKKQEAKKLVDQTVNLSRKVTDSTSKNTILSNLAEAMCAVDLFDKALETAQSIKDDYYRAMSLTNIARSLLTKGKKEEAVSLLKQSLKIAKGIKDPCSLPLALSEVGEMFAQSGQIEEAKKILADASKASQKLHEVEPDFYPVARDSVIESMAESGLFDEALKIAKADEDPRSFTTIVEAMARHKLFDRALTIAKEIPNPKESLTALAAIIAEIKATEK